MILFLFWIINKIGPIVSLIGLMTFLYSLGTDGLPIDNITMLFLASGCALLGVFVGIVGYKYGISVKDMLFKSRLKLMDNIVSIVISYAYIFFMFPYGICGIIEMWDIIVSSI